MATPIPIPLGSRPYSTAWTSVGMEVCENLYLERSGTATAKAEEFYIKIPGLSRLIDQASTGACRGLVRAGNGRVFGVFGVLLYEILPNWTRVLRATLATYSGPVGMADDGTRLLVVDGTDGWTLLYADNTVEQINPSNDGDEGFPRGATHCTCLDTYFLVNNPATNEYAWSNVGYKGMTSGGVTDPAAGHWNGLNVGKKIGKPDNIVALGDCNNMLWLFGSTSTEVHYDTGDADQTWARYEGAIIEVGCAAPYSVRKYLNNIFWMGADAAGTVGVFTNDGLQPKRISVRGIEQQIQAMTSYSDAIGMTWAENGHTFYLLHFPTGDKTFVYDLTTDTWHARTYLYREAGTTHQWRGMFCVYGHGANLFGDRFGDAVYQSLQSAYVNDDATGDGVNSIKCVKTLPINFQAGRMVRYLSAQPMCYHGVGLAENTAEGVGEDPKLTLKWSDDGGVTYASGRQVRIGRRGQYKTRSRVTTLGAARNRVWKVEFTDPTPFLLVGFLIEATPLGA